MGIDWEIKIASKTINTTLTIIQLKKLLDESANFCNIKTFTEESLCKYKSMKTYIKMQPVIMNTTQSFCSTILTKCLVFAKVRILMQLPSCFEIP